MNGALLLVTSDREFERRIEHHLQRCRIDCRVTSATDSANELVITPQSDVVLLDLDGTDNPLRLVRSFRTSVGCRVLLTCSWKDSEVDVILAYEAGADDYFVKSTDLVLVEAKLRRAIRRRQCQANGQHVQGVSSVGIPARRELVGLIDSELTRFESRLLQLLANETGPLVPRAVILKQLWGRDRVDPKLLYEHISTLRTKLLAQGWTISNVRGKGYRLERSRVDTPQRVCEPASADLGAASAHSRSANPDHGTVRNLDA